MKLKEFNNLSHVGIQYQNQTVNPSNKLLSPSEAQYPDAC